MSTPPRWNRLDERELREALAMKERFMALHRPQLSSEVYRMLEACHREGELDYDDVVNYAIENAHDLRKLLAPFDQGESL